MSEELKVARHLSNIPLRHKSLIAQAAARTKVNVFARTQSLPEPMAQVWTTESTEVNLTPFWSELERLRVLQETEA